MNRINRIMNLPFKDKAEVLKDLAACSASDLPALEDAIRIGLSGDWRRSAIRRRIEELRPSENGGG